MPESICQRVTGFTYNPTIIGSDHTFFTLPTLRHHLWGPLVHITRAPQNAPLPPAHLHRPRGRGGHAGHHSRRRRRQALAGHRGADAQVATAQAGPRPARAEAGSADARRRDSAPRFDVDGDGFSDMLLRLQDGSTQVGLTTADGFTPYTINVDDYEERQKDVITPGDLDGNGGRKSSRCRRRALCPCSRAGARTAPGTPPGAGRAGRSTTRSSRPGTSPVTAGPTCSRGPTAATCTCTRARAASTPRSAAG